MVSSYKKKTSISPDMLTFRQAAKKKRKKIMKNESLAIGLVMKKSKKGFTGARLKKLKSSNDIGYLIVLLQYLYYYLYESE